MAIPSNTTPDEFFKAAECYRRVAKDLADLDLVAKSRSRRIEILEEQVYFAQELLTALETGLRHVESLGEFRKLFAVTVENSNFER